MKTVKTIGIFIYKDLIRGVYENIAYTSLAGAITSEYMKQNYERLLFGE